MPDLEVSDDDIIDQYSFDVVNGASAALAAPLLFCSMAQNEPHRPASAQFGLLITNDTSSTYSVCSKRLARAAGLARHLRFSRPNLNSNFRAPQQQLEPETWGRRCLESCRSHHVLYCHQIVPVWCYLRCLGPVDLVTDDGCVLNGFGF